MADISKITLPSGTTYDIKDAAARAAINGTFVIAWNGAAAPTLASLPDAVTVKYNNTNYTGTLAPSASTLGKFYLVKAVAQGDNQEASDIYDEYITYAKGTNPETYAWEKIGDTQIKLTAVVTDVTFNKQTSTVIGSSATFSVTQPVFKVTPSTTYVKTTTSTDTALKKITTSSKKLQTTSIIGVQSTVNKASKATAATSQTTAKGTGTASSTNTDWLKGVSVSNEVLTIGAATMDTQTTTQFTFSDVDVPKKNSSGTTVANGELVDTSTQNNVGGTIVESVTSSGTGYTITALTGVGLATDSATATGRVQLATGTQVTASRTTDVGVGWNSKDQKTVLNDTTSITVSHPN